MASEADLLTIEETASKLRVNLDTVRRLLRQRRLPGVKIGAQWRVSALALNAYIGRGGDQKPIASAKPDPGRGEGAVAAPMDGEVRDVKAGGKAAAKAKRPVKGK